MKVFYSPRQTVTDNDSYSPSAGKPAEVLASWLALGLPIELITPEPCSREAIALAHDPAYVRRVLDLEEINGFGNQLPSVAAALPWTTGSFVSAARHAASTGEGCASLTSGFHHACYDVAGGYCTFNGLVIAAQTLRQEGLAERVGILDCDHHYGNGTDDVIRRLGLDYIVHYTVGSHAVTPANAEAWLDELPAIVQRFVGCAVIMYQAGADPHIDDPLGGTLTTEQMQRRDATVFATAQALGIPVVWNLAGGYQQPLRKVLDLHDNTARAFVAALEASHAH